MNRIALLGILALTIPILTFAQDSPLPFVEYPEKFRSYLANLHVAGPGEHAFRVGETQDVDAWRTAARAKLAELTGLTRMTEELAGHEARIELAEIELIDGYQRQRGVIETEPGVKIPFWILRPILLSQGKFPLAICAHGHDPIGFDSYAGVWHDDKHEQKTRDHGGPIAVDAVKRGFVAIAPATRGLAREASLPDLKNRHGNRACRAQLVHALLAGRTAVGERVWDIRQLLDWALELPEVDRDRVVMLGNSGGGVLTLYAAALDERIKVAAPSCSFTSYTSSTGYVFHCDCCLIPRAQREFGDLSDVGGLISPRALLGVNGREDGLHHQPDVDAAMAHVRAIFAAAGVPDRFEHNWGDAGHKFYPELMWPFIEKHIR